jgi:hypothetical protein
MTAKLAAALTVFLVATGVRAQGRVAVTLQSDKPTTSDSVGSNGATAPAAVGNLRAGAQASVTPRQRMQEMQGTLNSMHALLKQMRAKATAAGNSKDSLAKANLEMWELMLSHLDKQFDQLRVATLARDDLEARRAAMYRQAMARTARPGQGIMAAPRVPTTPVTSPSAPPTPKE